MPPSWRFDFSRTELQRSTITRWSNVWQEHNMRWSNVWFADWFDTEQQRSLPPWIFRVELHPARSNNTRLSPLRAKTYERRKHMKNQAYSKLWEFKRYANETNQFQEEQRFHPWRDRSHQRQTKRTVKKQKRTVKTKKLSNKNNSNWDAQILVQSLTVKQKELKQWAKFQSSVYKY